MTRRVRILKHWRDFCLGGLLLGTILASACVFTPREPEDPSGGDVQWTVPTEPVYVLDNMKAALEAKYTVNYENSLAADFLFTASTSAVSVADGGYFTGFGRERELIVLQRLFDRADALALTWTYNLEEMQAGGQSLEVYVTYDLQVTYVGGSPAAYTGTALFTFIKVGSEWALSNWDETDETSSSTWGHLRWDNNPN